MSLSSSNSPYIRKNYGSIESHATLPDLIQVQRSSYENFMRFDGNNGVNPNIEEIFKSVFPINDTSGLATLEFVKCNVEQPKYDAKESIRRAVTYSAPLRVTLRLIVWDIDEDTGLKEVKSIKEQDVYMGDIPLMTSSGTFIVNGTERVVVSQLHRSPGVFFDHDRGKTTPNKVLYFSRIIPYRGSWLDFEFDAKDLLYFRIDRRRKLYLTTLLKALGYTTEDILSIFYSKNICSRVKEGYKMSFDIETFKGARARYDIVDARDGKIVVPMGTRINQALVKKLNDSGFKEMLVNEDYLIGKVISSTIEKKGEILVKPSTVIDKAVLDKLSENGIKEFSIVNSQDVSRGSYMLDTLLADKNETKEEALIDIYKVIRPGDPATAEVAESSFNDIFFNGERYDVARVGRRKINERLGLDIDEMMTLLSRDDVIKSIEVLIRIRTGFDYVDDIDHLGNRRVRSVGELLSNQFLIGLVRMQRAVVERMNSVEVDSVMPQDVINVKPLVAVLREFFGTSQLSQFMDQTNPLSEITHKRRLSALGPGGLTRDRASFEVRDVHPTHYGRICPIETPEGQNIGLINSLATYAKVNKYGFIESPYCKVVNGVVTSEVVYLSATQEGNHVIAQANATLNEKGEFTSELVRCRKSGDVLMAQPSTIDYMDVSPKQLVSVATSLIPFLENDDANRALMGSNMQRQAVPLLYPEAPLVGTGMEGVVARDSGVCIVAEESGIVEQVDATRIVVRSSEEDDSIPVVKIYKLRKFNRTNHDTCINQKPIVKVGDFVKKGDVIADGAATQSGELALGKNVLVAFMPWNGYNFEDSILISERLVWDDVFTSVHIEEFEVVARDTRLGPEEITRDIPNINEENLRYLDEVGIVHVGASVDSGDILVGKVTPKSESPATPEEKLLRAIFGEKAADVKDSSLRVPPGVKGIVVGVNVFTRRGIDKDERTLIIENEQVEALSKDRDDEINIIEEAICLKLQNLLVGQTVAKTVDVFKSDQVLAKKDLAKISPKNKLWKISVTDKKTMVEISNLKKEFDDKIKNIKKSFDDRIEKMQSGDDLPQGVLKMVKVFVAVKRKLQSGDKMAGRHGNKGVISRIVPVEDMPYLETGQVVDIVLNPLGVPSRMNVGQILETHLGLAAAGLGKKVNELLEGEKDKEEILADKIKKKLAEIYSKKEFDKFIKPMNAKEVINFAQSVKKGIPIATPVFDGAKEKDIEHMLELAGFDKSGQMNVFDGCTGDKFERKVTVGYIYMLKLHHLVDDKIHARSIGPYSLVTQQPLGGKSHFGGQRFGEMECWALQAYGAAYTLQEMLTVKSDDVYGRVKLYDSIVKGEYGFEYGIPESFNVMIKELRSLCLNIQLKQDE